MYFIKPDFYYKIVKVNLWEKWVNDLSCTDSFDFKKCFNYMMYSLYFDILIM